MKFSITNKPKIDHHEINPVDNISLILFSCKL